MQPDSINDTRQTSKKNTLINHIPYGSILFFAFFIFIATIIIWQTIQFYRITHTLKSLSSVAIREVRIYPANNLATGKRVAFSPPDTLIDGFLHDLADIRAYHGSPKGILSLDHVWFVEIETTDGRLIQMRCHLPANTKNVVHGELGKFYEKGGGPYYGDFQSQGLFQWYQQYSHRWLGENRQDEGISLESTQ